MSGARELLRRASGNGEFRQVDGQPLTSERLKAAIGQAFLEHGATADEYIVSHGASRGLGGSAPRHFAA